ncbi:MAG: hypothetical protein RMK20_14550, partial [Verrucomicrobiales bacterium]|nr:hypothetical protein [Verrucomicrobiales bacterium]
WNLSRSGRGVVTINTARTKALVGYATNRVWRLGEVAFTPGSNQLGWCTLGATLTRGNSFTNDATILVVANGWWENTGQVWKDANRDSVGNQWGGPPLLVEVVPFTLTLPVGTNRLAAWVLDERGQRRAALPVSGSATQATVTVSAAANSIWYEIEVAAALHGYNLWRSIHFTPAELTDPAISGDAAAPAGDGVPRLMKDYDGAPLLQRPRKRATAWRGL